MAYSYQKATPTGLELIWAKNIADNKGDGRWIAWKDEMIENNKAGKAVTFLVSCDSDPVGEGTLLLSPDCGAIRGRTKLCDTGTAANVNALRIQKRDEGKGHISKLMREMERFARQNRYSFLTIGVEASSPPSQNLKPRYRAFLCDTALSSLPGVSPTASSALSHAKMLVPQLYLLTWRTTRKPAI